MDPPAEGIDGQPNDGQEDESLPLLRFECRLLIHGIRTRERERKERVVPDVDSGGKDRKVLLPSCV